ncbi:MAG: hypothetical protein ACRDL1_09685 [Solirubrobacterales bacterium]
MAGAVRYLDAEEATETSIDAIGGASAGALVSFFTAHALLEGLDPEALLHETWVERVTLPLLRGSDSNALLSFDELRERVPEVLAADGPARADPDGIDYRQRRSLALHVQVTGLRGLTYPIRGLASRLPSDRRDLRRLGALRARAGWRIAADARPRGPVAPRFRPRLRREPRRLRSAAARPPSRRRGIREPRDRELSRVRPPLVHGRRTARRAAARTRDFRRQGAAS